MTKKKSSIIIITALLAISVCAVVIKLLSKNNNEVSDTASVAGNNEISDSQNEGNLGSHECLSKFRVERGVGYSGRAEILGLDFFQSFDSGAFFGRIKNYKPEQNRQLAALINQLMEEKKITTYRHLRADVCLYKQDLLNPQNGANLNYYVEHYYCTNSCQTGEYDIRVDLDADGNFVGYDVGKIY